MLTFDSLGRSSYWTCCIAPPKPPSKPNSRKEQNERKEREKDEKREKERRTKDERKEQQKKEKQERKKKKDVNVLPDGFQCADGSHNLGGTAAGRNDGVGDGRHIVGRCRFYGFSDCKIIFITLFTINFITINKVD